MVASAREVIEAKVADAVALPFEDGAFDLVVAFMSLQDMDDLDAAVREVGRVLERGGRFCFAVVHPINFAGRFESKEPEARFVIRGSYLEPSQYDEVIERDGFRIRFAATHRPLEAYSRALEAAGLAWEELREPPYAEGTRRWARVPLFLHALAVKA
jgi:SAM-dependent methyltransferase